jgi:predicted nuclease of predicted toxin-antitoxin system
MRIYIDDDSIAHHLIRFLRDAGHDVLLPEQVGLSGKRDPEHLTYAILNRRVLITRNYRDFHLLDILIRSSGGQHPGIILIRQDDQKRNDMKPHQIVQATKKIQSTLADLTNQCLTINHWR